MLCGAVSVVMFTDCGDLDTESLMTGKGFGGQIVFLRSYMLSNKQTRNAFKVMTCMSKRVLRTCYKDF